MTNEEAAWCAGFFEGEGSITYSDKTGIRVSIDNTDLDTLQRFLEYTQVGTIYGPRNRGEKRKPIWVWDLSATETAITLLRRLRPYLLQRRRQRIDEVIELREARLREIFRPLTCTYCGKEFSRRDARGTRPKHCSKICYTRDYENAPKDRLCEYCGENLDLSWRARKYCNKSCRTKWWNEIERPRRGATSSSGGNPI